MKTPLVFEKQIIGQIEKCYATLGVMQDGQPRLIFGGEGNGSLRAFYGEKFDQCDLIWEGGGGTMSIVPLPGQLILASRGFYSMVDCENSTVELIRPVEGGYTHETIATLDYLHRFDTVLAPDGTRYLFAAALHGGKADKADWSKPGHMFAGAMPADMSQPFTVELTQLPGDFYVNHGFGKGQWQGREAAFTASQEGVFVWLPPVKAGESWSCEQLLDFPVSDISVADVDGDGEPEIAALLPFHGNQFKIYRKEDGAYKEVFSYPVENDFYHAIINGTIRGEKMFMGGARKLAADVFLVRWDKEEGCFVHQQLEAGPGPSNLALLNTPDADLLLSANRMIFEAAIYKF